MAKVISFLNYKGGVAKTTTTVNVAKALHDMGKRVLVIDADSQGNSSKMMGKKLTEGNDATLYEVMTREMDIRECICMDQNKEDSFDFVPANHKLNSAEMELVSRIGRESVLRKALVPVQEYYDFILIDCTPSDGLISQNAITASDFIIVPLNGEPFAVDGMGKIIQRYKEVKENINPNLELLGYVFTLIKKCQIHDAIKEEMREQHQANGWPGEIFQCEIKQNVRLAETAAFRTNIFDYASQFNPKDIKDRSKLEATIKAGEEYKALAMEILDKLNK